MYGSARCASAFFHSILSVIIRMIFPPVARQRGIIRVVFRWPDGLCGSSLSTLGTSPVVSHGVEGKLGCGAPCRIIECAGVFV